VYPDSSMRVLYSSAGISTIGRLMVIGGGSSRRWDMRKFPLRYLARRRIAFSSDHIMGPYLKWTRCLQVRGGAMQERCAGMSHSPEGSGKCCEGGGTSCPCGCWPSTMTRGGVGG
jgi:hypothetical protein